jgi:hypothetical protein
MQTNCDITTISLAKQESQECAADRQLLALNSELEAMKVQIQITQSLMQYSTGPEETARYVAKLVQYRSEVQRLSTEIAAFTKGDMATTNVFVDNLLSNAKTMMGLFTRGVTMAAAMVTVAMAAAPAAANVDGGDGDGSVVNVDEGDVVVGDNGGN